MNGAFVDELSAVVGFSGNPLDRLSERRDDPAAVAALAAHPQARSLLFVSDTPVLMRRGEALDPFFTLDAARGLGTTQECVLLGQTEAGSVFATLLDASAAVQQLVQEQGQPEKRVLVIPGRDDLAVLDLRSIATRALVERPVVAMMAQAKSVLHWHAKHRFCANCGAPTRTASAGWRRECDACKTQHFPRTDPVVIMLATRGEKCLLGRQSRFGPGMYSALAGFLEPGETVEAAVRREIMEEAGVRVGRVTYLASQPWPFPASLMIGCLAEAISDEIVVDTTELEDARWFSRDEVRTMLAGDHAKGLGAPQPIAIARNLLAAWARG